MTGPKLDARGYAVLMLVVVAVLLTMNLVAQSSQQYNTTAASMADVSAGIREVAASNGKIAASLDRVAEAIGRLKLDVKVENKVAPAGSAPEAAPPAESAEPTPAPAAQRNPNQPLFETVPRR